MGQYDEAITHLDEALTLRQAKQTESLIESTERALALARTRREAQEK
jgi:hypothetical protein